MGRNYKDEYEKFQSSKKMKRKRAKLNKINRDKGTYGNGDGLDASHRNETIILEDESINRGRKEKSRLKGSKRKKYAGGGYNMKNYEGGTLVGNSHDDGGIPIEAEGGEFIIKKDSVNEETLPMLEKINNTGEVPILNAQERSQLFREEDDIV